MVLEEVQRQSREPIEVQVRRVLVPKILAVVAVVQVLKRVMKLLPTPLLAFGLVVVVLETPLM